MSARSHLAANKLRLWPRLIENVKKVKIKNIWSNTQVSM